MSETTQNLNIQDILGLISDANKSLEHDVYIPSLNKEIHLKPLNANHTKNIAKAAIEGPFAQNQFTLMTYNILKEVCDPSIPMTHLNVLDKAVILLELRVKNIKPQVEVKVFSDKLYTDTDGKQYRKDSVIKVDVSKILAKLKKWKLLFENQVIELDNYAITLNYPTIEEEYQFENNLFKSRIQNIDEKYPKALKTLVAPMFVNTLAQYVKHIKIGDNEIDLQSKKVVDRLAVVESLSMNASNKIIEKLDTFFGKQMNKITSVEETIDGETYTGNIELSPILFLS